MDEVKMKKVKRLKLKPAHRENRRYLVICESSNDKIEKVLLEYLGVLGFAKAGYIFVKKKGDKVIGSCVREELERVKAGLGMDKIKIEKVSGTLKGLSKN